MEAGGQANGHRYTLGKSRWNVSNRNCDVIALLLTEPVGLDGCIANLEHCVAAYQTLLGVL
jgi:hypothetical protein